MKSKIIERDVQNIIAEFEEELKKTEGKTVLITGANGFLGSYIADTISTFNFRLKNPCKLILINRHKVDENSRLGHLLNDDNVKFIECDVGKKFEIGSKIDIIFHAASRATIKSVLENPIDTLDTNINGLRTLLEYAKKNPLEKFVFFSSGDIYGNPVKEFLPTPENYSGNVDCMGKKAGYSESKRIGETMCMDFFLTFNVPVKILRIFNTYGPGLRNDGKAIANFFESAEKNNEIKIENDGEAKRSFLYVTDAIRGIFKVLFYGKSGEAYNIGDDRNNLNMKELALLIAKTFNKEVRIKTNPIVSSRLDYGIDNRYPCITKLKKLGFEPKVDLERGLQIMKEWYDEQK